MKLRKRSLWFLFLVAGSLLASERPKIGLVLSGGGARGFAHIGTLKLLDSLAVPVDCIVGTSMGGIVGALYSLGYSGKEIENLARRNDWEEMFTDQPPRDLLPYFLKKESDRYQFQFVLQGLVPLPAAGLVFGQKIALLLSSLFYPFEAVRDFDRLPIPYRCVAVDLRSGDEVVLQRGSLVKAVRTTMSIPTIFSPIRWGDSLLVDGGLVNNLPVDVARQMGAEFIIAVDVMGPSRRDVPIQSAIDVFEQSISILGIDRWKKNVKLADILIQPDLEGTTIVDFFEEKIKFILKRGDAAAHKALPEILELKNESRLMRWTDPVSLPDEMGHPCIRDILVTGHKAMTRESILSLLDTHEGDTLNLDKLRNRFSELIHTRGLKDLHFEVVPLADSLCRLFIRVEDSMDPTIHSVLVDGNENLPFTFIYRLLGAQPGQKLKFSELNQRIMEIYGLGYFEQLSYEIKPAEEGTVVLKVHVSELPDRRMKLGIRYDDYHQLVLAARLQNANFILPGTRSEHELQFAGLTRLQSKTYYPSRTLNMPIYPYLRANAQDIPTRIYDGEGRRIAECRDRAASLAFGLGLLFDRSMILEAEVQQEWMAVRPEFEPRDVDLFGPLNPTLRKAVIRLNLDRLDNVLLPRRGLNLVVEYEAGLKELQSQILYSNFKAEADLYYTPIARHTLRLLGYYARASSETPMVKWPEAGRPERFIGAAYDQLRGNRLSLLRAEYRVEIRKNLVFSVLGNGCFGLSFESRDLSYSVPTLWGYGAGMIFYTPLGNLELWAGIGPANPMKGDISETHVYLKIGSRF